MKKTGFTLAEVLITLSIIGVVAMMTLPALMTNVQEQQAKTGLKKGLNTLTEAAQMNNAVEGFDYASLNVATTGEEDQSLTGLFKQRMQYNTETSYFGEGSTTSSDFKKVNGGSDSNYVVFLRDGSSIEYDKDIKCADDGCRELQADGLPNGFVVLYDINGAKSPNIYSNCKGEAAARNGAANKDDSSTTSCTKSKRVIKDQFSIRLRGTFAQPVGAAAKWAFEH